MSNLEALETEIERLRGALDLAERERRWSDVAALRVELEAAERNLAQEREKVEAERRRLEVLAASRRLERERERLEAESKALQTRLERWNDRITELDKAARELWPELAAIEREQAENWKRLQAVGGQSYYRGHLCKAAVNIRDGRGALVWKPGAQ